MTEEAASVPPVRTAVAARDTRSAGGLAQWLPTAEFIAAAFLSIVAIALHVRFITSVGALWRDETNSVNVANVSSWAELWRSLEYDSFPVLFFAVLKTWTAMWGVENDLALRLFGGVIGVGILAVLWLNARALGARWPVLSVALVGLNPMVIRYGDSVRAYGLGIILILLTFYSFWRIADPRAPLTVRRVLAATVLALLSVQCLYYNSVLLLAIGAGTAAVALRARDWRKIGVVVVIGSLAALSLLPYMPMMRRMRAWTFLVSYPADFKWIWQRLSDVTGSPDPLGVWIWSALFIVALGAAAAALFGGGAAGVSRQQSETTSPGAAADPETGLPSSVLFAAVTAAVGVVGYATFLNVLNYYTQPWYYITLVAFAACALDVVFGAWKRSSLTVNFHLFTRSLRVAVAVALLGLGATAAWEELPIRHTNADAVAARLTPMATKGDLVLVPRWEFAIPLSRYYRGPAEIMTLPAIDDHRFHRYDLVVGPMFSDTVVPPVLTRIEQVLRAGNRVFIVGELPFPAPDAVVPTAPPMHQDHKGNWYGTPPNAIWDFQTGQFLRAHGTHGGPVPLELPPETRIRGYEKMALTVVAGWR